MCVFLFGRAAPVRRVCLSVVCCGVLCVPPRVSPTFRVRPSNRSGSHTQHRDRDVAAAAAVVVGVSGMESSQPQNGDKPDVEVSDVGGPFGATTKNQTEGTQNVNT